MGYRTLSFPAGVYPFKNQGCVVAFTTIAFQQFNYNLIIYPLSLYVNCVEPFLMRKICLPCVKGDLNYST